MLLAKGRPRHNSPSRLATMALLRAAQDIDYDGIRKALRLSASQINARDAAGRTALMLLAASNAEACMRALLEAGAAVELKDAEAGQTALHIAGLMRTICHDE